MPGVFPLLGVAGELFTFFPLPSSSLLSFPPAHSHRDSRLTRSISQTSRRQLAQDSVPPPRTRPIGVDPVRRGGMYESEPLLALSGGVVTAKLLAGVHCEARTEQGETALHLVSRVEDEKEAAKVAKIHLRRGARVDATCLAGWLPLHAAAFYNNSGVLQVLLSSGSLRHLDRSVPGGTALHIAAQRGSIGAMEQLLLAGADANVRRASDGLTPLHIASRTGKTAAVQMLLNHGADIRQAAANGEIPMHAAAAQGHTDVVVCLAQWDSSLLTYLPEAASLGTPLHVLARHGHTGTLEALLAKSLLTEAALRVADVLGHTPLASVCAAGQLKAARLLLDQQRHLPPGDLHGALSAACREGHASVAQLLLRRLGSEGVRWEDVPEEDHPLMAAVRQGHHTVVQVLLAAQVSLPHAIVWEAAWQGDAAVLGALLEAGAHPAGDHAAGSHYQEIMDCALLVGRTPLLAQLLSWGLDPQHPAAAKSPLLQAMAAFNHAAARLLLQYGASPDGQQKDLETPLHAAARLLDLEGLALLLGAGADAAVKDGSGRTALDVVLEICTDADVVELTGIMWPTPRRFTERDLLLSVEALMAAGGSCDAFLQDNSDPELVHPSLLLAIGRPAWSPAEHSRWPQRFRAAAREFLLLGRARGVRLPTSAASGRTKAGKAAAGWKSGARSGRLAGARQGAGGQRQQGVCLPAELCCAVLGMASSSVSEWV